jgi:hypothetical protein
MSPAKENAGDSLHQTTKRILTTSLLAIGWIAAVAFGVRILLQYENTPGRIGALPRIWPDSGIVQAKDRPTLLFASNGNLLFNGGITGSRGHAGDNAIISLVNNQEPARTRTLVFGCALANRAVNGPNALCLR